MNAYEIGIWRSCYYDSAFSHNGERVELIHARNAKEAESKVTLRESEEQPQFKTNQSKEFIHHIYKIGTVTIKPFYVYSDGRTPRPVNKR